MTKLQLSGYSCAKYCKVGWVQALPLVALAPEELNDSNVLPFPAICILVAL
jgi:hypothetical protein